MKGYMFMGIALIGFIIVSISVGVIAGIEYGFLTFGIGLLIMAIVGVIYSSFLNEVEEDDEDWW